MTDAVKTPLDLTKLLRETFLADGEVWQSLDSTNNRAKDLASRSDLPLPFLVAAEHQTEGRGRGDRRWWTGPGSLAVSLILDVGSPSDRLSPRGPGPFPTAEVGLGETPAAPQPAVNLLGLLAGVAVCQTVRPLIPPSAALGLHWPNDVFLAGRKLSGILVEVPTPTRAVIGIGINVNNPAAQAPEPLRPLVISLRDVCGMVLDRTEILVSLLRGIERWLAHLRKEPTHITAEANRLCLQRDQPLVIQCEWQTHQGICRGIDPSGALLLETPAGVQKFFSGTVVRT